MPVAQRIYFNTQHDGEPVCGNDGARFFWRISDLQPPFAGAARLFVDPLLHLLHRADLDLDRAAIIGLGFGVAIGSQQLIIHSQRCDQAQSALIRAVKPVDIGLLMHQRAKTRPDIEIGPAAAGGMPEFRVEVDQAAMNRLA